MLQWRGPKSSWTCSKAVDKSSQWDRYLLSGFNLLSPAALHPLLVDLCFFPGTPHILLASTETNTRNHYILEYQMANLHILKHLSMQGRSTFTLLVIIINRGVTPMGCHQYITKCIKQLGWLGLPRTHCHYSLQHSPIFFSCNFIYIGQLVNFALRLSASRSLTCHGDGLGNGALSTSLLMMLLEIWDQSINFLP